MFTQYKKVENKIKPKKYLGQNFLQNDSICNKIVNHIDVNQDSLVLEVGVGQMALTNHILAKFKNIILIETDESCVNFCLERLTTKMNFTKQDLSYDISDISILKIKKNTNDGDNYVAINCYKLSDKTNNINILLISFDALQVDIKKAVDLFNLVFNLCFNKLCIISNLPYNIGTLLVYKWIENSYNIITSLTLMLQKEVCERIVAKTNTKDYGKLSVVSQLIFKCKILFDVSADNFFPRPSVISSVIFMKNLYDTKFQSKECIVSFSKFLTQAFSQKRKNISNVFKNSKYNINLIKEINDIKHLRIEDLSPSRIYDIYSFINNK